MRLDFRPDFVERVCLAYKDRGEQWLQELPPLVERVARKWGLTGIDPGPSVGWSFVAYADRDEERVVLKLVILEDDMLQENRALREYGGVGAVRLLEEDLEARAGLLERSNPGTPLKEVDGDEERVEVAIEVLHAMLARRVDLEGFPVFCEEERQYFSRGEGVIEGNLLRRAVAVFDELAASGGEAHLVHGDFHPENILFSQEKGWQLIDPDGRMADREFDAATMVRNELWTFRDPLETARRRARRFADALNLDHDRLWKWAFAQAVLAACWGIEDRDGQVPRFIQTAEVLRSGG